MRIGRSQSGSHRDSTVIVYAFVADLHDIVCTWNGMAYIQCMISLMDCSSLCRPAVLSVMDPRFIEHDA